ncbi:MAG: hypothetical protein WBB28_01420 [Crinalium sp.]
MIYIEPPKRERIGRTNHREIVIASDPGNLQERRDFAESMAQKRQDAVDNWYAKGGDLFLKWTKKYYRTWSGEKLRWNDPFLEEAFILMGCPWIVTIVAEKSAQVGWTELGIALNAFFLAYLRVPVAYGVEMAGKLSDIVGPRIQTAFGHIEPIQKLKIEYKKSSGIKDTDTKTRHISVGGVDSTYFYASTSGGKKSSPGSGDERQASSALSSFTAFGIIADEIELWSPGAIDIARQRQEACWMPTKPLRAGSTPGRSGGVVDTYMKEARYLFQWNIICPSCGKNQFLDGFGNLLKKVAVEEDGKVEDKYLNSMCRPLKWFCRDDSSDRTRISSAYIGCQYCEAELPKSAINSGHFVCKNTGISLLDFHDQTIKAQLPVEETVGLRLPKLATTRFSASERIRRLLKSKNPVDEIQQGWGIALSQTTGRISLERIEACVGFNIPLEVTTNWEKIRVIGCDQGHAANIFIMQDWWLPEESEDPQDRWQRAYVETIKYGYLGGGFKAIDDLAIEYGVTIVGIDSEPEIEKAGDYSRDHSLKDVDAECTVMLFDQVCLGGGQKYRCVNQKIQGRDVPLIRIHRSAGLDAVRDRIYSGLHRMPEGLIYNPKEEENFIYQIHVLERMADSGWTNPDKPDHYFHALNFAEMAVLVNLIENPPGIVFGSMNRNTEVTPRFQPRGYSP